MTRYQKKRTLFAFLGTHIYQFGSDFQHKSEFCSVVMILPTMSVKMIIWIDMNRRRRGVLLSMEATSSLNIMKNHISHGHTGHTHWRQHGRLLLASLSASLVDHVLKHHAGHQSLPGAPPNCEYSINRIESHIYQDIVSTETH